MNNLIGMNGDILMVIPALMIIGMQQTKRRTTPMLEVPYINQSINILSNVVRVGNHLSFRTWIPMVYVMPGARPSPKRNQVSSWQEESIIDGRPALCRTYIF